jgi:mannose/fructose/N-acetylgalactosamine-specific phosphotransferase system component IIC
MENKVEKYKKIKSIVMRRFIIKISGFSLLFVAGIVVPLVVRACHLWEHGFFGEQRPENVFGVLAVGIGLLGIITSVQYLYNSMKLLKEKMRKDQAENVSEEERQISSTEKIVN